MRSKGFQLNASDVVELGCHSAASKAIGRRSVQSIPSGVWDDLRHSATQVRTAPRCSAAPVISPLRVAALKSMFPNLEERVIVMVIQEARSEEATIDTLLTLAAPSGEEDSQVLASVQHEEASNSVLAAEPGDQGWMVCSSLDLDDLALSEADSNDHRQVDGALTGVPQVLSWSDRAKAAASLSAPLPRKVPQAAPSTKATSRTLLLSTSSRTPYARRAEESLELLGLPPLTEYELDHKESLKQRYLYSRSCRGRRPSTEKLGLGQPRRLDLDSTAMLQEMEPQQVLA